VDTTLLLVGCGKMGSALLEGWLERGIAPNAITIIEPNAEVGKQLSQDKGVSVLASSVDIAANYQPEIIVFAVKPQIMADIVPDFKSFAGTGTVFLSIAAGKTIEFFENHLSTVAPIVRSMPNTPAAIQRGIAAVCANSPVTNAHRRLCQNLLEAVSDVIWIDDESLMDTVTAVSGSGPAYVFLLAECMAEAGISAGLPVDLAYQLARATVAGSGEMLHQMTDAPSTLRENVTSPGGTTAAALDILMDKHGLQSLLTKAIAAATARSKELAD